MQIETSAAKRINFVTVAAQSERHKLGYARRGVMQQAPRRSPGEVVQKVLCGEFLEERARELKGFLQGALRRWLRKQRSRGNKRAVS